MLPMQKNSVPPTQSSRPMAASWSISVPAISGQNISATPPKPKAAPSSTRRSTDWRRKIAPSSMLKTEASEKMTASRPEASLAPPI